MIAFTLLGLAAVACVVILAATKPKPILPPVKPSEPALRIISVPRPMALSREDVVRALARELLVQMRDEAARIDATWPQPDEAAKR